MIKHAYGKEAWAVVLCLSGTKVLLVQEELPKQQVTVCHTIHAHLISHHAISFSFPA
jgi:hypothetical protein